jgi:hypothetical protein
MGSRTLIPSTQDVANSVCGKQGHQIAVLAYPASVKDVGGYEQETPSGYVERCTACGATLEEIRKGFIGE